MKTKINELCRAANVTTAYQLQKLCNLSPSQAARIFNDKVEAISLSVLETLCNSLKCSPNDIFGYDVKADKLPEQKPISGFEIVNAKKKQLRTAEKISGKTFNNSILEIVNSSSDNEYTLTTAAAGELLNLSPRSVRENAEKGLLPGKQGKQNHWYFRRSDVDEYKARRG